MRYVEIPRTGDVPLSFRGEPIAFESSRRAAGEKATRWHEITAYRTEEGRYVLHVGWRSTWRGEAKGDAALVLGTLADAEEVVHAAIPPVQALPGYPEAPPLDRRRAALEEDAMLRFHDALSALLVDLAAEELPAGVAVQKTSEGQAAYASGY